MIAPKLRLGLCCQFIEQPVKFRVTTATALQRLPRREQLTRLAELAAHNAGALLAGEDEDLQRLLFAAKDWPQKSAKRVRMPAIKAGALNRRTPERRASLCADFALAERCSALRLKVGRLEAPFPQSGHEPMLADRKNGTERRNHFSAPFFLSAYRFVERISFIFWFLAVFDGQARGTKLQAQSSKLKRSSKVKAPMATRAGLGTWRLELILSFEL